MNSTVLSKEEDSPKDENQLWEMLSEALSIMKQGHLREAMAQLDEILFYGSSDFELLSVVYKWYGRACRKLGQLDKAYNYFSYELQMHRFTQNIQEAADTSRRIVEICVRLGKHLKAKRSVLELVEFATDNGDIETATDGLLMLADVLLEQVTDTESQKELVEEANSNIREAKKMQTESISTQVSTKIAMTEAKSMSICGNHDEAIRMYEECISQCQESNDYEKIHTCHYEIAKRCCGNWRIFAADHLRSALLYAELTSEKRKVIIYSIEISKCLHDCGKHGESLIYALKALEMSKDVDSKSLVLSSMLVMTKALVATGRIEKAARIIVDASILAVLEENESAFGDFYAIIDGLMARRKNERTGDEDVEIIIEAIDDEVQSVVKLEHTTTIETWKISVRDIIEARRKAAEPPVVVPEEQDEEPMDLFEMISKMNRRMDEQRSEMPKSDLFARPARPLSSLSSRKVKSHRLLPGLRANIAKLNELKIDKKVLHRLLKKKNKSKVSINSDSLSCEAAPDVTSDIESSTICSASDLASLDSASLNKENVNVSK